MKKYVTVILGILLVVAETYSRYDWQWQNPYPQGNDLKGVYFVNVNVGYAAGDKGIIIKTIDAGVSWKVLYSGTSVNFEDLFFVNKDTGWVVGQNRTILSTADGGSTWASIDFGTSNSFTSVQFSNSQNGTVSGWGATYKTIDGGQNWSVVNTGSGNFAYISIANDTIWGVSNSPSIIYRSTDNGNTWNFIKTISSTSTSIQFIDGLTGFMSSSNGVIFYTVNGGAVWNNTTVLGSIALNDVFFINKNRGWGVGQAGYIKRTDDGGVTWTTQATNANHYFNAVHFIDINEGWAVGRAGLMFHTVDGGTTWNQVNNNLLKIELYCIGFADDMNGFSGGEGGYYFSTSDSGSTWILKSIGASVRLNDIQFMDRDTGWVVGGSNAKGVIYKTTDGGSNWNNQYNSSSPEFYGMAYADSKTAWAVGAFGKVYQTTNGTNWSLKATLPTLVLSSIVMLTDKIGWVAGGYNSSFISKTTDGGNTWVTQDSASVALGINSIYFLDTQTGWAVGDYGTVMKTINGGDNWVQITAGINVHLEKVKFLNDSIGYSAGDSGFVYISANGGQTWSKQKNPSSERIYDIHFNNGLNMWTAGLTSHIMYSSQCVGNIPGNAGPITGTTNVYAGLNNVPYSVSSVSDGTSYHWILPPGAEIASGYGTNSITVNYTSNVTSGVMYVFATNSCGPGKKSIGLTIIGTSTAIDFLGDLNKKLIANIYPIPIKEQTTIEFAVTLNGKYDFVLYDIVGSEVQRHESIKSNVLQIRKANLRKGVYFGKLIDNSKKTEKETVKLIIE